MRIFHTFCINNSEKQSCFSHTQQRKKRKVNDAHYWLVSRSNLVIHRNRIRRSKAGKTQNGLQQ